MKRLMFTLIGCLAPLLFSHCATHSRDAQRNAATEKTERPSFVPAPASPLAVESPPADVVLSDLNRDDKLDILVGHERSNRLSLLLGDGRGGFKHAPGSPFDGGMTAGRIAVGDFNNDRHPDIAFTHHDSNSVAVMLGRGGGRFERAASSPFTALAAGSPHNHGLSLADLDEDGNLDITTANQNDNSVSLLLGDGRGGFRTASGSPFAVGRSPYPQKIADVNGDGHLDVVTPNVQANDVSVLLGDGKGNLRAAPGSPFRVEMRPFNLDAGDLNGDGKTDLVVSHDDINLLSLLVGDGRGGFAPAPNSPFDLGYRGYQIILHDMNGDAKPDAVVSSASADRVAVLQGDGRGNFRHAPGSPYATGRGGSIVAVGDVNGDGRSDIVTAHSGSSNLTILLGN